MMTKQNPANYPNHPPTHICFCKLASSHSGLPSMDPEELAHKSLVKPHFGAQTPESDLL